MALRQKATIADEAKHLVRLNQSEVPSIERSYVFADPEGKTIRVVHVDRDAFPEERVMPIQFGPDNSEGLSHPMLIAIVDSHDPERLELPEGWGRWADAQIIERARRRKAS